MDDLKKETSFEITQVINQSYKYGFVTDIEKEAFPTGINEDIVKLISTKKKEPQFLLEFRLKAYDKWKKMTFPEWANLTINKINFIIFNSFDGHDNLPEQKHKRLQMMRLIHLMLHSMSKVILINLSFKKFPIC